MSKHKSKVSSWLGSVKLPQVPYRNENPRSAFRLSSHSDTALIWNVIKSFFVMDHISRWLAYLISFIPTTNDELFTSIDSCARGLNFCILTKREIDSFNFASKINKQGNIHLTFKVSELFNNLKRSVDFWYLYLNVFKTRTPLQIELSQSMQPAGHFSLQGQYSKQLTYWRLHSDWQLKITFSERRLKPDPVLPDSM